VASAAKINPLSANDIAGCQAIIDTAPEILEYLSLCQDCGLDVASITAQVNAYADFAAKVKAAFGGGNDAV
jgi:hypothetical protein